MNWLFDPDPSVIFHFKISLKNGSSHWSVCHLHLNRENNILSAIDLIRLKTTTYDLKDEEWSFCRLLNFEEISPLLKRIETFLQKCPPESPFKEYFSEDPHRINSRLIRILDFVKMYSFQSLDQTKNIDEILVNRLKQAWATEIAKSKSEIIKYLQNELKNLPETDDTGYREAILQTEDAVFKFNFNEELEQLHTVDEIIEYWPTLFLPAPPFVNELYYSLS